MSKILIGALALVSASAAGAQTMAAEPPATATEQHMQQDLASRSWTAAGSIYGTAPGEMSPARKAKLAAAREAKAAKAAEEAAAKVAGAAKAAAASTPPQ